jgi:hypothetical protein
MLDVDVDQCDLLLEIAGFRYYERNAPFLTQAVGEQIALVHERSNQHDPNAVEVLVRGARIGYVNRLQAPTFLGWIHEHRVTGVLERLNGNSDHPRAFIFVHSVREMRSRPHRDCCLIRPIRLPPRGAMISFITSGTVK